MMARAGKYAHAGFVVRGSGSRESMKKAGTIVLRAARAEAAKHNRLIAAGLMLGEIDENSIEIYSTASASKISRAFEFGLRHPLMYPNQRKAKGYGGVDRGHPDGYLWFGKGKDSPFWRAQKAKPFLDRAMEAAFTAAVDAYADVEAKLLADENGLELEG